MIIPSLTNKNNNRVVVLTGNALIKEVKIKYLDNRLEWYNLRQFSKYRKAEPNHRSLSRKYISPHLKI